MVHIPPNQQVYYIYYGTASSGVSSLPVGNTTTRTFVVNKLQQDIVYVFEVSLGSSGRPAILSIPAQNQVFNSNVTSSHAEIRCIKRYLKCHKIVFV